MELVLDKNENADCAVEITKLKVLNNDWWTLGFDYFIDKDDERENNLGFIVDWILKDYPDNNLHKNNSWGYSEWLLNLNIF